MYVVFVFIARKYSCEFYMSRLLNYNLQLAMSSIRVVYLQHFLNEIEQFFTEMSSMQSLVKSTAEKAKGAAKDAVQRVVEAQSTTLESMCYTFAVFFYIIPL